MIEKEVLGQCLLSDQAADTAIRILSIIDFSSHENKETFKAIATLRNQGKTADLVTVSSIYKNIPYLASLSENIATTRQIKQHCEILKERSLKSAIISKVSGIVTCSNQLGPGELIEKLQDVVKQGENNNQVNSEIRDLDIVPYRGLTSTLNKFIPTGIPTIDNAINDLVGGCVTLIAGRNNSGKTTFCNQIIANAIDKKFKVLVVNGEETQETTINKLYTAIIGRNDDYFDLIKVNKKFKKEPKPPLTADLQNWHKGKLKLFSKGESTLKTTDQLFAMISHEIRTSNQDLIVLDNLMSLLTVSSANEKNGKQADFMQKCCDIAKKHNVHIVVVVHPNKTYRKGEELDSEQISGTSDLANKADNVITVIREYDEVKKSSGVNGYIQLQKNRYYSDLPKVSVHFEESTGLLLEMDFEKNEYIGYPFNWSKRFNPNATGSNSYPFVSNREQNPSRNRKKENTTVNKQRQFFIDN